MLINLQSTHRALEIARRRGGLSGTDEGMGAVAPRIERIDFSEEEVADDKIVGSPRAPTSPGSGWLNKILPITVGADGTARIFGLPPALAYGLAVLIVGGGSYYGWKALSGGKLVLSNPFSKKRRNGRRGRSRC